MTDGADQRKLQSLLVQIRSYQTSLTEISRQNALMERAIEEMTLVLSSLEELPKTKDSEAFVPIGAGIFIKANITDKENPIVSIGSGISVQKSIPDTKEYLEARKAALEADNKKLQGHSQKIMAELEAANQAAEEMYSKLQK
jgi:prefoldin alpha subunit